MVKRHMPSPFGHTLAGIAAAWTADLFPGRRAGRTAAPTASYFARAGGILTIMCAALGAAPDLDLFLPRHRGMTHSAGAVILIFILASAVTGWVREQLKSSAFKVDSVVRVALMCAAAYTSHLLLDWLAVDRQPPYGLQVLWPFTDTWYISGFDIFPQTERSRLLSLATARTNLRAMSF